MSFRLKAASGGATGQTFDLANDATSIGSDENAHIRLEGLRPDHAQIRFDGTTLMLHAESDAWVNGSPVARQPLKSGDEIRLGEHRFVLQAPGLRPPSVLQQTERPRINPMTWVAIAAVALGGAGAIITFVLSRM